jgi:hypothetical protein
LTDKGIQFVHIEDGTRHCTHFGSSPFFELVIRLNDETSQTEVIRSSSGEDDNCANIGKS